MGAVPIVGSCAEMLRVVLSLAGPILALAVPAGGTVGIGGADPSARSTVLKPSNAVRLPEGVSASNTSGVSLNTAETGQKKVVFLHIQSAGGTSFMSWINQVHAMCARQKPMGLVYDKHGEMKGGTVWMTDLDNDALLKGKLPDNGNSTRGTECKISEIPDATAETAGSQEMLEKCGAARKLCHFGFKDTWKARNGDTCDAHVEAFVDAGCTRIRRAAPLRHLCRRGVPQARL